MLEIFAAVMLTLCVGTGILLRYVPFASDITQKQRRMLRIIYIVCCGANLLILTAELYFRGLEAAFDFLRFGGIFWAAVLTLVNILVIQRWLREQMFVFGIVITCHYLLMTVPNYVITLIHGLSMTQYIFVVIGMYLMLLVLTCWPLCKLLCNTITPFLLSDSGEYWNTIWFMPLAYFAAKYISLGGTHDSGSILQLISSVLSGTIMVFLCVNIAAGHGRMLERQLMEEQLSAQKMHYTELKARIEETRKAKHDFKHHIAAIRHFVDIDDKEGLRNYCDELTERSDGQSRIPYTGNAAADGVLYHYMQRAEQAQVRLRYSGTIHSHGIADVDLSVLLGNALDNALAACMTIPDGRSINIISQSEEHLLSIVVQNTFDGLVLRNEEGVLSRKRKNSPGHGLASMRFICERYGGSMDVRWDQQSFTVIFILPLIEGH